MSKLLSQQPQAILMPSPVDIGEPHSVGIAHYRTREELAFYLRSLRNVNRGGLAVVVGIRDGNWVSPVEISAKVRLVFTADSAAVEPHAFAGWFEPDPFRAVVLTMLNLRPEEGLILLLPADWTGPAAESLIDQGRRWRASLEADEAGDFHRIDEPN